MKLEMREPSVAEREHQGIVQKLTHDHGDFSGQTEQMRALPMVRIMGITVSLYIPELIGIFCGQDCVRQASLQVL